MKKIKKKPFLIAEIGGNHGGDLEYAKKLVTLAKNSGADAVKFQTYSGDLLVNRKINPERCRHFDKLSLSIDQFIDLYSLCEKLEIEFMTSVWDIDSLNKLDPYLKRHKIGSGDLTNYQILEKILSKDKPLIISTAMATFNEIHELVNKINQIDNNFIANQKLTLLHCVAMYGSPQYKYANLGFMDRLIKTFPEISIGYSDHVKGNLAVLTAIARGAKCIEVHFTDNKNQEFRDHHLSVLPQELKDIRSLADVINDLFIDENPDIVNDIEDPERIKEFRRAIYPSKDIRKDDLIRDDDLILLRPNIGLDARYLNKIIGARAKRDIKKLEIISMEDFLY